MGHLQKNKARRVAELFPTIESVDSLDLARKLAGGNSGKAPSVLLQVNVAEEPQKYGLSLDEVPHVAAEVSSLDGLIVRGLMTIAPKANAPEEVRPCFRALAELSSKLRDQGRLPADATELSMGMTDDMEIAIEEGATMIRVGTDLFGARTI